MTNKVFKEFADKYQLVEGNSCYHGVINGYFVNVEYATGLTSRIYCCSEKHSNQLSQYLQSQKKALGIINYVVDNCSIIAVTAMFTMKKGVENLEKYLLAMTQQLASVGVLGSEYCPLCGQVLGDDAVLTDIMSGCAMIHSGCKDAIIQRRTEEKNALDSMPNNYAKATLGAVLGALVGGVALIILYLVGFVSVWTGLLGAFLAGLLYKKFGGKTNWTKAVIVGVVTLVVMVLGYHVALFGSISAGLAAEGVNMPIFEAMELLFEDAEFVSEYVKELLLVLFFSIGGIGYTVYQIFREAKSVKQYYAAK